MKRIFTLAVLCFAATVSQAQYYYNDFTSAATNPRNLNTDAEYPVGGGLDPTWTTFHNPSASPAWSPTQTIPFTFNFNGSAETQFKVSNSGCLTFDVSSPVAAPSFTSVSLPSATVPDKSVCILGLSGTGTNDYVVKKTFGTAPNRQHWIFFTSYTNGSGYTYWSIVLEEGTNNIYVVDQRNSVALTSAAIGIQVNATTAYALNGGSNNVSALAGTDPTSADNAYYEFIYGSRPAEDMSAVGESVPSYVVLSQAPFSIVADFRSFGANNVTSYGINYSVNNGPAVTGTISSVNVATQGTTTGTHPTGWTPGATGIYNIKVWADNINGNPDAVNYNDTFYFAVNVVDTLTTRKSCMEVFTSSTCGPCVAGNANMDNNIVPNIQNYTIIKYQQDFPGNGDPYANTESVNRRGYYGISSIPRMEIDGQWDGNAAALTVPIFNSYQQVPSFMEIAINSVYYAGTTVTVSAQIKPLINYGGSNYRYHVVVIENQTTGNVGTNGETSFNQVMMNMHPTETGTAITSLTALTPININVNVPMAGTNVEQMSDLMVVIFVQDNDTKEILQSEWMNIVPNGVQDLDASGNGINNLYPNPAQDQVTMQYSVSENQQVNWTMTNMMGQTVKQGENESANQGKNQIDVNTSDLTPGVYFMNLTTNDGIYSQKVIISE
jgi:hypothetical protein